MKKVLLTFLMVLITLSLAISGGYIVATVAKPAEEQENVQPQAYGKWSEYVDKSKDDELQFIMECLDYDISTQRGVVLIGRNAYGFVDESLAPKQLATFAWLCSKDGVTYFSGDELSRKNLTSGQLRCLGSKNGVLQDNISYHINDYRSYFVQLNTSVNLGAHYWDIPIGVSSSKPFTGEFSGLNGSITGLTCTQDCYYQDGKKSVRNYRMGLFGYVGAGAKIHNLKVNIDYDIKGSNIFDNSLYWGNVIPKTPTVYGNVGLIGEAVGGTISSVEVLGEIKFASTSSGGDEDGWQQYSGIVGRISSGSVTVENCVSRVDINVNIKSGTTVPDLDYRIGGIVGCIESGANATIKNCFNFGNITTPTDAVGDKSTDSGVGGCVGRSLSENSTIQNCHNFGEIACEYGKCFDVGGVVGYTVSLVSGCTNWADIKLRYLKAGAENTKTEDKRGHAYGGVVGKALVYLSSYGISGCANYGNIYDPGGGELYYVGGIAGSYEGMRDMASCYNHGSINFVRNNGEIVSKTLVRVGGIAGCYISTFAAPANLISLGNINVSNTSLSYVGEIIGYWWTVSSGKRISNGASMEVSGPPQAWFSDGNTYEGGTAYTNKVSALKFARSYLNSSAWTATEQVYLHFVNESKSLQNVSTDHEIPVPSNLMREVTFDMSVKPEDGDLQGLVDYKKSGATDESISHDIGSISVNGEQLSFSCSTHDKDEFVFEAKKKILNGVSKCAEIYVSDNSSYFATRDQIKTSWGGILNYSTYYYDTNFIPALNPAVSAEVTYNLTANKKIFDDFDLTFYVYENQVRTNGTIYEKTTSYRLSKPDQKTAFDKLGIKFNFTNLTHENENNHNYTILGDQVRFNITPTVDYLFLSFKPGTMHKKIENSDKTYSDGSTIQIDYRFVGDARNICDIYLRKIWYNVKVDLRNGEWSNLIDSNSSSKLTYRDTKLSIKDWFDLSGYKGMKFEILFDKSIFLVGSKYFVDAQSTIDEFFTFEESTTVNDIIEKFLSRDYPSSDIDDCLGMMRINGESYRTINLNIIINEVIKEWVAKKIQLETYKNSIDALNTWTLDREHVSGGLILSNKPYEVSNPANIKDEVELTTDFDTIYSRLYSNFGYVSNKSRFVIQGKEFEVDLGGDSGISMNELAIQFANKVLESGYYTDESEVYKKLEDGSLPIVIRSYFNLDKYDWRLYFYNDESGISWPNSNLVTLQSKENGRWVTKSPHARSSSYLTFDIYFDSENQLVLNEYNTSIFDCLTLNNDNFLASNPSYSFKYLTSQGKDYGYSESITLKAKYRQPKTGGTACVLQNGVNLVESADNLVWISEQIRNGNAIKNATFKQTKNIDLKNVKLRPIGTETNQFSGYYDGNGYVITGLGENDLFRQTTSGNALFGYVNGATIRNLNIYKGNIIGYNNIAGVAVNATNSTFDHITTSATLENNRAVTVYDMNGKVKGTETRNGGAFVANATSCKFIACGANVNVSLIFSNSSAFGDVASSTLDQCFVEGKVSSSDLVNSGNRIKNSFLTTDFSQRVYGVTDSTGAVKSGYTTVDVVANNMNTIFNQMDKSIWYLDSGRFKLKVFVWN